MIFLNECLFIFDELICVLISFTTLEVSFIEWNNNSRPGSWFTAWCFIPLTCGLDLGKDGNLKQLISLVCRWYFSQILLFWPYGKAAHNLLIHSVCLVILIDVHERSMEPLFVLRLTDSFSIIWIWYLAPLHIQEVKCFQ